MFIDFNDMSKEGQTKLKDFAEAKGISIAELVEEFNELASDPDNVFDFLTMTIFLNRC